MPLYGRVLCLPTSLDGTEHEMKLNKYEINLRLILVLLDLHQSGATPRLSMRSRVSRQTVRTGRDESNRYEA